MQAAPPFQGLRGLWVDAFGPGLKTPAQVSTLVRDAAALHINVLFAQVVRRGDCYCNLASVPRTEDPDVPAGFDPLAALVEAAHAAGIQVHAWMIPTAVLNLSALPTPQDPTHVINAHGSSAAGDDNWLMQRADGETRSGDDVSLDLGNPAAAGYMREMVLSIVRNYAVDGVQLDRVRYPDPVAGVPDWGYNPAAVARYQAESGTDRMPAPGDPAWTAWRRQQVTDFVGSVYAGVKAIRPAVWVSAATITYGPGPRSLEGFRASRTYSEVLQDWPGWLQAGKLDLVVLMNYKRESSPSQAGWFSGWNRFARTVRGRGRVAVGTAMYLNDLPGSLRQLSEVADSGLDGWVGYSYRTPDRLTESGVHTAPQVWARWAAQVVDPSGRFAQNAPWGQPQP
ncbi:MAG: glycoside hydrolase family 10 protein [Deinococcus sp.]